MQTPRHNFRIRSCVLTHPRISEARRVGASAGQVPCEDSKKVISIVGQHRHLYLQLRSILRVDFEAVAVRRRLESVQADLRPASAAIAVEHRATGSPVLDLLNLQAAGSNGSRIVVRPDLPDSDRGVLWLAHKQSTRRALEDFVPVQAVVCIHRLSIKLDDSQDDRLRPEPFQMLHLIFPKYRESISVRTS